MKNENSKFSWGEGSVKITRPTKEQKEALLKKQSKEKKCKSTGKKK